MAGNEENKEVKEDEVVTEKEPESPQIHFEPVIKLPVVDLKNNEESEDVLLQIRAKLFRYDTSEDPGEWKERGVGDCRILKHKETGYIRILMRRDKTLKICANHYINPSMELKPNCGSDRAWVWSTSADFADEECKEEVLAIRFGNSDKAQQFKTVFDDSKTAMKKVMEENPTPEKEKEAEEVKENGKGDGENEKESEVKSEESDKKPETEELSGQLKELSVKEA